MAVELPPIGSKKPPLLELGHLWRYNGATYCFREMCEGCKFDPTCQREETIIKVGSGINIRRAVKAPPGFKIVSIDYKGVELRVAGQLSGEPSFIKAFKEGRDLHYEMAKLCFKTETPTKEQRRQTKCANFGNLFLGNAYTLARQSDLDLFQAAFVWNAWWRSVPYYKRWTEQQFEFAKANKFVSTFFGRRRPMEDMIERAIKEEITNTKGKGKGGWGFVKRTSVNSPVQGTAADLMKLALLKVDEWITKNGLEDRVILILSVHDELVFYVKDDEYLVQTCRDIQKVMCPDLSNWGWQVPIETDCEIGDNWALLTGLDALDPRVQSNNPGDISESYRPQVPPDRIVLVVNTQLTETMRVRLENALLRSSRAMDPNSPEPAVLVPVKMKIAGKLYSPGSATGGKLKVNEYLLRNLVKTIPGIDVEDEFDPVQQEEVKGVQLEHLS